MSEKLKEVLEQIAKDGDFKNLLQADEIAMLIHIICVRGPALGLTVGGMTEQQREAVRKGAVQRCIDLSAAYADMTVNDAITEMEQYRDNPQCYGDPAPEPVQARRVVDAEAREALDKLASLVEGCLTHGTLVKQAARDIAIETGKLVSGADA